MAFRINLMAYTTLFVFGVMNTMAQDGHARMLKKLDNLRINASRVGPYQGDAALEIMRKQWDRVGDKLEKEKKLELLLALGQEQLKLGFAREAVATFELGLTFLPDPGLHDARDATRFFKQLALAWLRIAETENCCDANSPESCLLPLQGKAIHSKKEGSEKASEYLLKMLKNLRPGSFNYREASWLLNLAQMTLGNWPDGVAERYRLPADAFAEEEAFPRFTNIAAKMGMDTFSLAGSALAEDFDGDGDLDLLVSTADPAVAPTFYRNTGNGQFEDHSKEAGLEGLYGGLNMVKADYDNDGDTDVLVLRGAWQYQFGAQPNSLLQNQGNGSFVDVTFAAGLAETSHPTQTAAWADYDNDGFLDLYIGNESIGGLKHPNQLFHNNGDGTFSDATAKAGVGVLAWTKSVAWGDVDGDGLPDLYVSNYQSANQLFRNLGDGRFEDIAAASGVDGPTYSFPAWFWDANNDGNLDLFVSAYKASSGDLMGAYLEIQHREGVMPGHYLGNGKGAFERIDLALKRPNAPMGCNFGDLDADGWQDIYLGTGWPNYEALMPNVALRNKGGKSFGDITFAAGLGHLQKGHGVAMADYDNDGDLDIFQQMGGFYTGDRYYDCFYENPGSGNHWFALDLEGVQSNRSAIGARVHVVSKGAEGERHHYAHVGSGASFGGNPFRVFMGLGKASEITRLEIYWPTTGKIQTFQNPPTDRLLKIKEDATTWTEPSQKKVKLGGE